MKAVFNTQYGSPAHLEIRQVPKPEPKPDAVLIRVHTTTVNRTDCGMLRGHPWFMRIAMGWRRPKLVILGMDFAGIVESVGHSVTSFKPGDRVFGLSPDRFGAHAEYLCQPERGAISHLPKGIKFAEAVVCEGAWYANTYLTAFGLKAGQRILIYGASGAIGTAAVQLAKYYGATVTAVVSTRHLDLVKSLGADKVIDYSVEDFTHDAETYDFILDAVGKTTHFQCRHLLAAKGRFSATDLGPWYQNILLDCWSAFTRSNRIVFPMPKYSELLVDFLQARLEAGEFRAVIERTYPFDAIVDAYRYVERAKKTGIVVINLAFGA